MRSRYVRCKSLRWTGRHYETGRLTLCGPQINELAFISIQCHFKDATIAPKSFWRSRQHRQNLRRSRRKLSADFRSATFKIPKRSRKTEKNPEKKAKHDPGFQVLSKVTARLKKERAVAQSVGSRRNNRAQR